MPLRLRGHGEDTKVRVSFLGEVVDRGFSIGHPDHGPVGATGNPERGALERRVEEPVKRASLACIQALRRS